MVIDVHDDDERHTLLPKVVAESFSEGVAGHGYIDARFLGGGAEDSIRLYTADRFIPGRMREQEIARFGMDVVKQARYRLPYLEMHGDDFTLAGFLFNHSELVPDTVVGEVVNVRPAKPENVADAQRGMYAHDEQ